MNRVENIPKKNTEKGMSELGPLLNFLVLFCH